MVPPLGQWQWHDTACGWACHHLSTHTAALHLLVQQQVTTPSRSQSECSSPGPSAVTGLQSHSSCSPVTGAALGLLPGISCMQVAASIIMLRKRRCDAPQLHPTSGFSRPQFRCCWSLVSAALGGSVCGGWLVEAWSGCSRGAKGRCRSARWRWPCARRRWWWGGIPPALRPTAAWSSVALTVPLFPLPLRHHSPHRQRGMCRASTRNCSMAHVGRLCSSSAHPGTVQCLLTLQCGVVW